MAYVDVVCAASGLFLLLGAFALLRPRESMLFLGKLPRSAIAGKILSSLAFAWAAWAIWHMPLDFLSKYKMFFVVLLAAAIPLSWKWMAPLLPLRALGGIFCLVPAPVFAACRFWESPLRLVLVVLAYAVAAIGMVTVFSPFYLRDFLLRISAGGRGRIRAAGAVLSITGAALALTLLAA